MRLTTAGHLPLVRMVPARMVPARLALVRLARLAGPGGAVSGRVATVGTKVAAVRRMMGMVAGCLGHTTDCGNRGRGQ